MFRIVVYCEDRQLATVLHRLVGYGSKPPEVTPVANPEDMPKAKKPNGAVREHTKGMIDGFVQALRKSGAEINAESAREAAAQCGGSATSYSYYLRKAITNGLIKRKGQGNGATYEWRT